MSGFDDEWYEEQGAVDHSIEDEPDEEDEPDPDYASWTDDQWAEALEYDPDDVPEHEDGDPKLEDLLMNLRERDDGPPEEVVEQAITAIRFGFAMSQDAVDQRTAAWKTYYEKVAEDKRREAQDKEGWGEEKPEEEAEVGMGATQMPLCPACGWTIDLCDVHDEEELDIIRKHDAGEHEHCDPEGCPEAMAKVGEHLEKLYGGEVDPGLHFDA